MLSLPNTLIPVGSIFSIKYSVVYREVNENTSNFKFMKLEMKAILWKNIKIIKLLRNTFYIKY